MHRGAGLTNRLYADLDMNCLRPVDSLLAQPFEYISPSYLTPDTGAETIAVVGSMETGEDKTKPHAIPNAFMASAPRHPLWLLPLTTVLTTFDVDEHGKVGSVDRASDQYATERTTGPIVLYNSVLEYLGKTPLEHRRTHPLLIKYDPAERHSAVVLQSHLIYPFSWATEPESSAVYSHCRASKYARFDAERCHGEWPRRPQSLIISELLRVYEKGSRTVTYWSHTWHQDAGGTADLSVAGQARRAV